MWQLLISQSHWSVPVSQRNSHFSPGGTRGLVTTLSVRSGKFEHVYWVTKTHTLTLAMHSHCPKATLVDSRVEMRRKLGLLTGLWCQHAFITLRTTGGLFRGRCSRHPRATLTAHSMLSMSTSPTARCQRATHQRQLRTHGFEYSLEPSSALDTGYPLFEW